MTRTRVTVTLNRVDIEDDSVLLSEWVHADGYSSDENGVRLSWGHGETYVPWSSILRVDWDPCECLTCRRDSAANEGPAETA